MAKMAVEDTSLTAVADAIRTKGGTTDALVFPDGFVSAVGNIQTGIDPTTIGKIIDRSITEVTADMLEGCTSIGEYALYGCNKLTSIVFPDSVTTLQAYSLGGCMNLTEIVLPDSLEQIKTYAFVNCQNVVNIHIPENLKLIGPNTFTNCFKLANIVLPKKIAYIDAYTFMNCRSFTSIVIPNNVKTIYSFAFGNCESLTTIEMEDATPPTLYDKVFSGCTALSSIIVPKGSLDAYKTATNWSAYADIIVEASE